MNFKCKKDTAWGREEWDGTITNFEKNNNYYEFWIKSRSSIMVIFGTSSRGGFACMPDFKVGCHLVDLRDSFWNTEQLIGILGEIDGTTVAMALFNLADKITV